MTFEEFTQKVLEKFDISLHVMRMHYTLKFNPRVIQDLEDDDDLDNVVSHSDDFANVYIVESPGVEAIEANIPNTQLALGGPHPTFPSSNASCDANPNTMMLSRGFASRCADTEYTPLESNRFREAILGAVVVEDVFRTTPKYLPRQICKDFERDHGVQLTYNQAWYLKEKAKERVYGSPRASYAYLPWLCHRLREINPGTIAEYTSHEGHFKQLFIGHAFSIQGFTMGCRPVLAIDSCHLSGPYKGALLSAIAYDADDGMFPLALGVVGSENYEDWYWFLEKLKGILDDQEVIIISDRHQGILRNVSELFGVENHAYCYRHVKENFSSFFNRQNIRGKKGKEDALLLLDNIAYARLDIDYNEAFEKLVCFNGDLARWVAENSPEHWAMSKFLKKRWDKMTTNIAESFNAWLREERHQTIYTLLMMHMDKLVAMLDTHMRGTDKWKSVVGPKTEEKLMSNITRSAPITVMPYLGGTFKVFTREVYLVVDMQQHKCTCLTWQMSGLPCPHLFSWSVYLCITFYFSMPNDVVIILTMAGNGLDGSAASSLPLSGTSMFTRCSAARFKKLCNRLPEAKIQAIRDLQFGGLLNLNCTEVTSTSSDHPFGTIRACEEKLLDLPVGEEFRRAFIYYACATLLAPTSRLNGCRNLWHTIHEDGFRNDVNWAQFVLDQLVEGIRRYQQSKTSWVHGCVLFLQASQRSPTVERTMEPETNVDHDTNVDAENSDEIWHQYHDAERAIDQYQRGIQQQLRIMRGLMHNQHSHSDDHAFPGDEYMASHAAYHVLDTPDRVVAPEYELQPSVPINVVSDGEEQPEGNVVPTNRNVRRRRVRRMAPNLLSPYISQPQTKQSAIKIDLKQGAALVFGDDLDASEELVSMHDTILTRGNLGCFEGNGWIGNDVVDAYCRLLQYQHEPKSKLFLSPYIAEMVIHSQAKHLVREAVIGRFEPHLYQIDIPYVNVNEVFLPVLIKNHWTLYVYDLENRRIQLLDSRPGRKKTMLSGVQQNLAKVVLWLAAHKKEVSPYDLRTFNFITPDVPLQTNE
ncbi:hypothetical protein CK203_084857 [Vitis vinifera]|uniref:SWIM-type domain-containing protein n=1 Tax=Vitis vinifera TaxID=29760 RepID=A0A438BVR7_VITVI|nr:hypothetical protein CK203_084857 [Vitis vinifera]